MSKKPNYTFIGSVVVNIAMFCLIMSWRLWDDVTDLFFTMWLLMLYFNIFTIYFMSRNFKEIGEKNE